MSGNWKSPRESIVRARLWTLPSDIFGREKNGPILGDYVDPGDKSIETCALLIACPKDVCSPMALIRLKTSPSGSAS
jgi:hypothetical protein